MSNDNTFSLSLQKRLKDRNLNFESEINNAFNVLNIRTLLHRSNIKKQKGHETVTLLYMLILLPLFKRLMTCFWDEKSFIKYIDAKKDVYYRFLNHECFNWRKFIYFLALQIIKVFADTPLEEKTLIVDDTIVTKTGSQIEMVSYHFDHKTNRSVLGNQCIQLGYHNGVTFYPIDMAFHTSNKRPNNRMRDVDKRTNGWLRRKEALRKKTEVLVEMIARAWKNGIDATFVLFDSWFSHDEVISKIKDIGYRVICRLKKGRVKYTYQGKKYTLKQLWNTVKKQTEWIGGFQVKATCVNVTLPKSGDVRILFVSDAKKQWHAFLCTDLELEASEILTYYARRWAIEVFFKDAKQLFKLGKEQSNTFDAVIASYNIVLVRYLLLVFILNKNDLMGPIGPLFKQLSETQIQLCVAEKMWNHIKERMFMSSDIVCYQIDPDIMLGFLDLIEDVIKKDILLESAKL